MRKRMGRITELFALVALAVSNLYATCWAGPPGPPTTPVGGSEIALATLAAIAGYGYWKSRK